MLFSQTVKLHWGWALLIFVAIGMYGDLLFSKLAGFDLQDLKDSL
jgi:D-alanyl-lipoteichoic acid acyltransferase DltB (MBOAT superfamily)